MTETTKQVKERQEQEKPQLQLLPRVFVEAVAQRLALGARQRGEWNWRTGKGVKLSASVYIGKALRHLYAAADGEWDDAEGGSHVAAAAADIAVVLDAAACGQLENDTGKSPETPFNLDDWLKMNDVDKAKGKAINAGSTEYIVWYSDDSDEWVANEAPMYGPLTPPSSSQTWMFVGVEYGVDGAAAVSAARKHHPRLWR